MDGGSAVIGTGTLEPLKKLMGFRLVMVTTLLLVAAYIEAVSTDLLPVNPLYFLIGATYALTVLHAVSMGLFSYAAQVYLQVIGDLLIITGLVYLTGGMRTGFSLLYPISVLTGSVLLHEGRGSVFAALATALYAATLAAVRAGLVPPQGLSTALFLPTEQVVYGVFLLGVACGTVAMIGSYMSRSLRSAGERLEEAAEQVADLQELNKVIIDSIHSGLITCDPAGRILWVNPIGETILGRRLSELRGRPLQEVFATPLLGTEALEVRAAREALARLEAPYHSPGGVRYDLGLSVSPLATPAPGGRGYLITFQDLTEVKQREHELRLKEKLAAVGEMAAKLAHEIRNPLGSISGSAQVLLREPGFSPDQERLLAIITKESKRLSEVLEEFLDQARPAPLRGGPLDLGSVIGEAVELLRNDADVRSRHAVEFVREGDSHVCLADPDRITQVFWNLARNGLGAMPEGGTLHVKLACRDDEVVLSLRDEGVGMPRDHSAFQPFESATPKGLGLGLAIVYQIVKEHRGDISIRSTPGRGTEVEVRLPRVVAAVTA